MSIVRRISYSNILKAAREVWGCQSTADKIAKETFEIITKTSEEKLDFYSGKSSRAILGGLFYLLGIKYAAVKTQKEVAVKLYTTDVTIRYSYRRWLEAFSDFFQDVIVKLENENHGCSPHNISSKMRNQFEY